MAERGPFKPSYFLDEDVSALSGWCGIHGYTCHVKLNGSVELREKPLRSRSILHEESK